MFLEELNTLLISLHVLIIFNYYTFLKLVQFGRALKNRFTKLLLATELYELIIFMFCFVFLSAQCTFVLNVTKYEMRRNQF